jgi:hypothetical protein
LDPTATEDKKIEACALIGDAIRDLSFLRSALVQLQRK